MIIKLIVDRLEESQAVLITQNGQEIVWPIDKLPVNTSEGQELVFSINSDLNQKDNQKDLAKDILNEILNNNE